MNTKIKNLIFASLIAVPLALASCNKEEKKEECNHSWSDYSYVDETYCHRICSKCGLEDKLEHTYSNPTTLVEPTCCTEGSTLSICTLCQHDKYETIPATGVHKYDQNIVLPDGKNLKAAKDCYHPDIYYKTCACGEFIKNDDAPTFESGEALKHNITSFTVAENPTKTQYQAFEQFNPDGLTFEAHCSQCGEDLVIPAKDIVFEYVNGGNYFKVDETKVTANYLGLTKDITGLTVSKATNEILGMEDQDINCGDKVVLAPYAKYDKGATITVEVKDKDKNTIDYKAENAFNAAGSPYTATATLTGTDQYGDATETCDITVNHTTKEWVTGDFYDKLMCPKCGEVERSFRTQVDVNFDFGSTASATLDFSNLSSDSTEYKVYDSDDVEITEPITVSRNDYFPTLPDTAQVDEITEKYYAIEKESDKKHDINVSFNIVNTIISNFNDLKKVTPVSTYLEGGGCEPVKVEGYFILSNDIDCSDTITSTYDSFYYDKVTGNSTGFVGHFNGRGYSINNFNYKGYGLFSNVANAAVVENVNFVDAQSCKLSTTGYAADGFSPLLARNVYNSTFKNINVKFSSIYSGTYNLTNDANTLLYAVSNGDYITINNVTVDATCIDKVYRVLCNTWRYVEGKSNVNNYIIKVKDFYIYATNVTTCPPGVTVIKTKS